MPGIVRCRSLKMLDVVIADDFSVSQHVQRLVTSSGQTNYALRVLRCHGLSNAAPHHVHRATVVARLTYAATAWRGLTKASDCPRINSVIDSAPRLGYCSPDLLTFDELCDNADDDYSAKLFDAVETRTARTTTTTIHRVRMLQPKIPFPVSTVA